MFTANISGLCSNASRYADFLFLLLLFIIFVFIIAALSKSSSSTSSSFNFPCNDSGSSSFLWCCCCGCGCGCWCWCCTNSFLSFLLETVSAATKAGHLLDCLIACLIVFDQLPYRRVAWYDVYFSLPCLLDFVICTLFVEVIDCWMF